jgi:hypothetical protein
MSSKDEWDDTREKTVRRRPHLDHKKVGRFLLVLVLTSLVCAPLYHLTREIAGCRVLFGTAGLMSGSFGAGVAAWCGLRFKSRLCDLALLLSIPVLAYWGWVLYRMTQIQK